jgi:hypothetical protein
MNELTIDWLDNFFGLSAPDQWQHLFKLIEKLTTSPASSNVKANYTAIEEQISQIESFLSTSAWDLWAEFEAAPRASQAVIDFWNVTTGPKAVLLLDSMSVREVSLIMREMPSWGMNLVNYSVAGSEIPSDTDRYAAALGLPGRASLKSQKAPASFKLKSDLGLYVDSYQHLPFDECSNRVPKDSNCFIWHGWPDDALHEKADAEDAFFRFIEHTDSEISSPGFKSFIQAVGRGRELLITSDHGYANANDFQVAPRGDRNDELRSLGQSRYKPVSKLGPPVGRTIPPATLDLKSTSQNEIFRVAFGKIRPDDKGFPKLTHGGLSLMECCVPLLHLRGEK